MLEGDRADRRRRLGAVGEELAAAHLQRRGYTILERNFRTREGELDIVAATPGTIVFCEVKTRGIAPNHGGPLEAIDAGKRRRLRRMAGRWLIARQDRPFAAELRFDAIGITLDRAERLVTLEHLEGAF